MEEPKPLDSLFKEKIFRIPDYQRGYAWRQEQLKDFWEDLINLPGNQSKRSHYTGVLTLKEISEEDIKECDEEFWLVDDHAYHVYHIVDGQQRLTTFVIFLQAFVDFIKALPENDEKSDAEVLITENLSVLDLENRYLFKTKPKSGPLRTYIFGYENDTLGNNYLKFRIFGEAGGGFIEETFYTLNLSNAKAYFSRQLRELHGQEGRQGLQNVYRKLTKRFLFNEYVIKDEFDVFVAFETMNNRGKKLSDLELLKNRLIYLTTLYSDEELDAASRKSLRETINDAWKEVYRQLGRNKTRPLNDDEFLRAHWIMFFRYSRKTGQDYIRFLLNEQFTPKKVLKKVAQEVPLETPEETRSEQGIDDFEDENGDFAEDKPTAELKPMEIKKYVDSLRESAVYWFNSFYPYNDLAQGISDNERPWIDRLNRIGRLSMKMNEKNILTEVEKTLRVCLQRVPFLEIESLERELKIGDVSVDIVAAVRIAKQRQRLALEVKNNGQPRVARAAAYRLARVLERETGVYGVFAAPYISPQTAEICVKEKIGYLDLAGNCRLTFGQVYIEQEGKRNPFAEKRDLRSLYSPKAARVLRVLLTDPKKPWRLQALADEAKVSLGQVANVKRLLEDREWLKSSDAGLLLNDPDSLLSEWSENYNFRKNAPRNYYTLKRLRQYWTR